MKTSFPNSPNFNASRWRGARLALMSANDPRATVVLPRQTITDTDIEDAKVVNVETPVAMVETSTVAKALGLTVPALKALCKARGIKGYSKLRKHELEVILA